MCKSIKSILTVAVVSVVSVFYVSLCYHTIFNLSSTQSEIHQCEASKDSTIKSDVLESDNSKYTVCKCDAYKNESYKMYMMVGILSMTFFVLIGIILRVYNDEREKEFRKK